MTTPSTARKAGPLLGTGSQTSWPFAFKIFSASDIAVTIANTNGVETALVLNTDYSVTVNSNQETSPGGTVTYPLSGSPLPVGSKLSIVGNITYDQPLDLPTGGPFSPTAIENQLDRTTMQIQQLKEEVDRSAKLPVTNSEDANALVADLVRLADSADNIDTVVANLANITTVADDLNEPVSEINTVAGSINNVNTVGNNITNVNTVAGINSAVSTVAGNNANVSTVAGSIASVNNVSGNIANVNAVNSNASNINTVAGQISPVNRVSTVAGIASEVQTVAGISSNVTAVAGNSTNVNTVAGSIANVNTVSNNIANVNTVAGINAAVSTVATNNANVSTVAGNVANVNTVAGISGNVTSVAGNATNINAVAGNATNINAVNANSSNINAVAGNATNINTVATNAANVNAVGTNIAAVTTAANNIAAIIAAPSEAAAAAASAAAAAASAASGMYSSVQDKSANYTVVPADAGDLIRVSTGSGPVTITLPAISTQEDGFKVAVAKWSGDADAVTIQRSGSDLINGSATYVLDAQYKSATFVADFETNSWFAAGTGGGGTNIIVDSFNGTGSQTAFTLSGEPGSENNTQVFVSGVYQEKDTYTVIGTTLTFSVAPPAGTSNIEVVWSVPLGIGTPSDGTVSVAKLGSDVVAVLNSKANTSDVNTALAGKANTSHTHVISDVTGLQTALAGKANTSHTHVISDVTGLQTALAGKANTSHTHVISDVTGLQTALDGKLGTGAGAVGTANIADGAVTDAKIAAVAATKLTGTVPTARLGSGTANNTTFLRGDQTWQAISTTPTTDQVLTATAGASAGAVGTYAFLARNSGGLTAGTTYAGSELEWTSAFNGSSLASGNNLVSGGLNGTVSGTWRALGSGPLRSMSLMLRIS